MKRRRSAPASDGAPVSQMKLGSGVNHKFQKVSVWVAHVDARPCFSTASLPWNRTYLYPCPSAIQHSFHGLGRALPHKAEVTARRRCCRSAIRERLILPARGTVKVDHVFAEIDRTGVDVFDHV